MEAAVIAALAVECPGQPFHDDDFMGFVGLFGLCEESHQ